MGFFSSINSILLSFDLMTDSPNLKIEGKNCYQTAIGGIMNVILTILSVIGIIYFGLSLIIKADPLVVESSMEGHQVGPFNINEKEFNLFMGIEFPNFTYYMNEKIYNINATVETNSFDKIKGQSYDVKQLDFGICTKYYSVDSVKADFDIRNFWCFAPNQAVIEGFWGSQVSTTVKFYINKCVNTTANNNHCLPLEDINKYIQGGILSMFTTNSFLNLNDAENPVEVKLQNWYNSLNTDFTYDYFYNLKQLTFEDDKGFLLQDINVKSYFFFENPLILYFGHRDNLIATVNVLGEKYGTRIQRSYTKVQDVLTRIGGLLKAITLVASFIANTSSHIKFYSDSLHNFNMQISKIEKNNKSTKAIKLEILNNDNKCFDNAEKINSNNLSKPNLNNKQASNKKSLNKQTEDEVSINNKQVGSLSNFIKTSTQVEMNEQEIRLSRPGLNNFINNIEDKKVSLKKNDLNVSNSSKLMLNFKSNLNVAKLSSTKNNNSLKFEQKNTDESETSNKKLLASTLSLRDNINSLKDFMSLMFDYLYCPFKFNKKLIDAKRSYDSKLSKILSINYIIKKFYFLEKLINSQISDEQQNIYHKKFVEGIMLNMKIVQDDTDVFYNSD